MPIRLAEPARDAYAYPLLIRHLLRTPLRTTPQQEIVFRDSSRYTYEALDARVSRLAAGLARLGVQAGTTVAVMGWDCNRYLECFFAVPMMGAVLQTVNVRLSSAQIGYTLRHAAAEVILVHRDFLPLLAGLREQLPALRAVVMIEEPGQAGPAPEWVATEYETMLEEAGAGFDFRDFDENALATTFYTTGTTGDPKGVCFSHRQLVLHTLAVMGAVGTAPYGQSVRRDDVYMPMTPMFHVHAWGYPYVATLMGMKQVYPGRYVPQELLALRRREGVTFSHCVPSILQMLLAAAPPGGDDMRGWKMIIGGAALSLGLAREAVARGMDVWAGYGMSETCPVVSLAQLAQPPGKLSADQELAQRCRSGTPVALVDVRLEGADGSAVPGDDQSVGEVVLRAPWLTPCYVGNPEASAELWRGGYLHTQDIARMDASGSLQICDRTKDVIKTGGEWLSSLQLESVISTHPGVSEVAVIAVHCPRWGERPHVLVVARPDYRASLSAEAIRQVIAAEAAAGRLPRYAVPDRVTFVEQLERTSVGKINKRLLRDKYA